MKILTAEEMQAADQAVISRIGIPGRVLMESAGREIASVLVREFTEALSGSVVILAGGGNNGGDGYVIARVLRELGVDVTVLALSDPASMSGEAGENAKIWLAASGACQILSEDSWENTLEAAVSGETGVLLDALFGTGFQGEMRGFSGALVDRVMELTEQYEIPIIAVDIPSGINASTGAVSSSCMRADATVTLASPKLGQALAPGMDYVGDVYVADIGISTEIPEIANCKCTLVTTEVLSQALAGFQQDESFHKGNRGHTIVVGGSSGHVGAAKMTAHSALVCGSGLVTLLLPQATAQQVESELEELMCAGTGVEGAREFTAVDAAHFDALLDRKKVVIVGPGYGEGEGAAEFLLQLFAADGDRGFVIDADALNLIASNKQVRKAVPSGSILTPHPGEMARLMARSSEEVNNDRLASAAALAEEFKSWVVLKGARTIVAGPGGEIYINPTVCESLATAGSGDVLAGVIGALRTRGLAAEHAAVAGVFLHGIAGEQLHLHHGGPVGATAGDISKMTAVILNEFLSGGETSCSTRPYPGGAQIVLRRL